MHLTDCLWLRLQGWWRCFYLSMVLSWLTVFWDIYGHGRRRRRQGIRGLFRGWQFRVRTPQKWVRNCFVLYRRFTLSDAEALGVGERRKIPTDKGKQHELQRLKDHRTVALRHVTRQINKMKPILADLNNYDLCQLKWKVLRICLLNCKILRIIILTRLNMRRFLLMPIHGTMLTMEMALSLNSLSLSNCPRRKGISQVK